MVAPAVACAGASTCQLGLCRSRGALEAIISEIKETEVNLEGLDDFRLHISGCSNSCGQHKIADLGFFGKVSRKGNQSYPAYSIVTGARLATDGSTRLSQTTAPRTGFTGTTYSFSTSTIDPD